MDPDLVAIVFSKDRAMQLDAMLRSLFLHDRGSAGTVLKIIYKSSEHYHEELYQELARRYTCVRFMRQTNFKLNVLTHLIPHRHVLFLVDDAIFVRPFCSTEATAALTEHRDAIGLSLRLGRNTTYCYPLDSVQPLPEFYQVGQGMLSFDWTAAHLDFRYPLEVSSSIFRVGDLLPHLRRMSFQNPNALEAGLDRLKGIFVQMPRLLCYEQSVAFCAPLNIVQTTHDNRASRRPELDVRALARKFRAGQRVDVEGLSGFVPRSCHEEVDLAFKRVMEVAPKVSIIMACHDSARHIREALDSVLTQTFRNFELIIVADTCKDDTVEVAISFTSRYPELTVSILEVNGDNGSTASRSLAISQSKGQYILPLDPDDKIAPSYLQRTVEVLDGNASAGYVYVDALTFGESSRVHRQYKYDFQRLCQENFISYCSLIRRQAFDDAGGYDSENWGYAEDWDLWIRLGKAGWHPIHLRDVLFYYRLHPSVSCYNRAISQPIKAFIVTRHDKLFSPDEVSAAKAKLASMPDGWHRQPPIRDGRALRDLINRFPKDNDHWLCLLASQAPRATAHETERSYDSLLREYGQGPEFPQGLIEAGSQVSNRSRQGAVFSVEPEIMTTVFVSTIGDPAFGKCVEAIASQDCGDFRLEFIPGVRPFSSAFQQMIDFCRTDYFIQVDEDMILFPHAVSRMQQVLRFAPDDVCMICFYLWDDDRQREIQGVKIWRTGALKGLMVESSQAADMDPLEALERRGYHWIAHTEIMGRHGVVYTPETIYWRYKSMYEKNISVWNYVTWDARKKADEYRRTGDTIQLFGLIGAVHGIIVGPDAERFESKDFAAYMSRELDVFRRLFLDEPSYVAEYDPCRTSRDFVSKPIPLNEVQWKDAVASPSNDRQVTAFTSEAKNGVASKARRARGFVLYLREKLGALLGRFIAGRHG